MRLLLAILILLLLPMPSAAQDGEHGQGHEAWHEQFYNKDLPGACCHMADCRPTVGRQVYDHYEVKVDGEWVRVLPEKVIKISPPDGGFHVCAPRNWLGLGGNPNQLYCVVLPPEY